MAEEVTDTRITYYFWFAKCHIVTLCLLMFISAECRPQPESKELVFTENLMPQVIQTPMVVPGTEKKVVVRYSVLNRCPCHPKALGTSQKSRKKERRS